MNDLIEQNRDALERMYHETYLDGVSEGWIYNGSNPAKLERFKAFETALTNMGLLEPEE